MALFTSSYILTNHDCSGILDAGPNNPQLSRLALMDSLTIFDARNLHDYFQHFFVHE